MKLQWKFEISTYWLRADDSTLFLSLIVCLFRNILWHWNLLWTLKLSGYIAEGSYLLHAPAKIWCTQKFQTIFNVSRYILMTSRLCYQKINIKLKLKDLSDQHRSNQCRLADAFYARPLLGFVVTLINSQLLETELINVHAKLVYDVISSWTSRTVNKTEKPIRFDRLNFKLKKFNCTFESTLRLSRSA
jgi:hypothetical protein